MAERVERIDNPIERLELLAGDDQAIASFLDQIAVTGPRDREMLGELARTRALADPQRFPVAHRRAVASLETLGRHGYHQARVASLAGPFRPFARWLVQLVARYVVVSYLRSVTMDMRNLYWLRAIETEPGSPDRHQLERARSDAEGLVTIFKRREIGLPSFVIGGLLIPGVRDRLAAHAGRCVPELVGRGDHRARDCAGRRRRLVSEPADRRRARLYELTCPDGLRARRRARIDERATSRAARPR